MTIYLMIWGITLICSGQRNSVEGSIFLVNNYWFNYKEMILLWTLPWKRFADDNATNYLNAIKLKVKFGLIVFENYKSDGSIFEI